MFKKPLGLTLIIAYYTIAVFLLFFLQTTFGFFVILLGINPILIFTLMVLYGIVAWGLWNVNRWAMWLAFILNILSLTSALIASDLAGLLIPSLIIIYLYFNRGLFSS